MIFNLRKAQQFLVFTAPILTSLTMSASPAQAATLALSGGLFNLSRFSPIPLETQTVKDSDTLQYSSPESSASTEVKTEAIFDKVNSPTAFSESFSLAFGKGTNYFGLAESVTQVIGNFWVNPGSFFSFDFTAELILVAFSDNSKTEKANASGDQFFLLLDTTDSTRQYLLDFLTVSGEVSTVDNNDFLQVRKSPNVNLIQDLRKTSFEGNEEFALSFVQGSLQRSFATPTALTLIQVQTNQATVSTPEPSSILGLLIISGLSGLGLKASRPVGNLKPKRTV